MFRKFWISNRLPNRYFPKIDVGCPWLNLPVVRYCFYTVHSDCFFWYFISCTEIFVLVNWKRETFQFLSGKKIYIYIYIYPFFPFNFADGAEEEGSCFPETSLVRLEGGRTKSMKDLQVGDKVASMDSSGKLVYSKVVTFLDINPNKPTKYVSIQTENPAAQVTITGSHLIYQLNRTTRQKSTVHARDLKVDDFVYVQNGSALGKFTVGRIVSVMRTQNLGAYAPLTETGTIVVDNVLCSCYAVISDAKLAHWSFAPLRFAEWLFPGCSAHDEPGIHWYARFLYKVYTSWNYVQEKFS